MKYNELIDLLKTSAIPDKEHIRSRIINNKPKLKLPLIIPICAIATVLVAILGYFLIMNIPLSKENDLPNHLSDLSNIAAVRANVQEDGTISTESAFKVTTTKNISIDKLQDSIEIYPKTEYSIKKNSGNTFTIIFGKELEENTLYKISSVTNQKTIYSWAFQTQGDFEIVDYSPKDSSTLSQNIEITFSDANVENFEQYFTISPSLAGTFEHNGNKWTFVPSSEYSQNTLYTVKISKDISNGYQFLKDDFAFSFAPINADEYIFIDHNGACDTFLYDEKPVAAITSNNYDLSQATVNIYSVPIYEDFEQIVSEYCGLYATSQEIASKLSGYVKVASFTSTSSKIDDKSYIHYPQTFDTGYYISEISFEDITLYHIYQVTDFVIYSQHTNDILTVWVNSFSSGTSVNSASVELLNSNNSEVNHTNASGLLTLPTENITGRLLFKVSNLNEKPLLCSIDCSEKTTDTVNKGILHTNSTHYRIGDTVKAWGFTEYNGDSNYKILLSTNNKQLTLPVDIKENGFFTTEFVLDGNYYPQNCLISLNSGDEVICSNHFNVLNAEHYYNLIVYSDKNAYFRTEKINHTIELTYQNGLPASDIDINVDDEIITTNEHGMATYSKTAKYTHNSYSNAFPNASSTVFQVSTPNGEMISKTHTVAVFDTDLCLTASLDTSSSPDNTISYTVTVNEIQVDKLNTPNIYNGNVFPIANDIDNFNGFLYDTDITCELHKVSYNKKVVDTYYDPVSDNSIDRYEYEQIDEIVNTETLQTENGFITIDFQPDQLSDDDYYYRFYTNGRVYGTPYINCYTFNSDFSNNANSDYSFYANTNTCNYGDIVEITLRSNSDNNTPTVGEMITSYFVKDELISNVTTLPDQFKLTFDNDFSENTRLYGAYFDGRKISILSDITISAQKDTLNVSLSSDKTQYSPGETAFFNLEVSDNNTVPQDAYVFITLTDGSLSNAVHITNKFNDREITKYASSYAPQSELTANSENSKAEEYYSFKSSSQTETLEVKNGKCSFSAVLPSDIEDINVVAYVVSSKGIEGIAQLNLLCKEALSIHCIPPEKQTPYTNTILLLKSEADSVNNQLQYSITVSGNDYTYYSDGNTDANEFTTIDLGQLDIGDYTVEVSLFDGQQTANYITDFKVKENYEIINHIEKYFIDSYVPDKSVFGSDIAINIYDEEYEFLLTVAENLLNIDNSDVTNNIVINYSKAFLTNSFKHVDCKVYDSLNGEFFSQNSDLRKCISTTMVLGDHFDRKVQRDYYSEILNTAPYNQSTLCAYIGLAALGEPILNDLDALLSKSATLSDTDMLYLALAYAYAGDYNTCIEIYNNKIANNLRTVNGVTTYLAETAYDSESYSALAAHLASKISSPDAKQLTKGILSNSETVNQYAVDILAFIKNFTPSLIGENEVTITGSSGEIENVIIPKHEHRCIILKHDDILSTRFKSENTNVKMLILDAQES